MGTVPNTTGKDGSATHPEGGPFEFKVKHSDDHDKDGVELSDKNGDQYAIVILENVNNPELGDVFHRFNLTDSWLWKLNEFQRALGKTTDGGYNWIDLVNMKVRAYIVHKDYQGKTYANVSAFEEIEGVASAPTKPKGQDDDMPF